MGNFFKTLHYSLLLPEMQKSLYDNDEPEKHYITLLMKGDTVDDRIFRHYNNSSLCCYAQQNVPCHNKRLLL